MSLILATGTNLGNKLNNLTNAKLELSKIFNFISESRIYVSSAIEYTNQPDFFNQVLEFKIPSNAPDQVMVQILALEEKLGRVRNISKGPRNIDIDIIFWDVQKINAPNLCIPHPSWHERSFVVNPLKELPFFKIVEQNFKIPKEFSNFAEPLKN